MKSKKIAPPKALALVTENGLTEAELKAAQQIREACPGIEAAVTEYHAAEGAFMSKFWTLAVELRKPQILKGPAGPLPAHRLNGREVTLLLLGLGEIKQRVTEWKRVVEMDDAAFETCRRLGASKLQALAVARGSAAIMTDDKGQESIENTKSAAVPETKAHEAKFHKLPKEFAEAFHALLVGDVKVKAWSDDVPYELKGMTPDGREYLLRLFVDAVAMGNTNKE